MVTSIERGQRLYIADEPDFIFEGALLELDMGRGEVKLDPLAMLTLDPVSKGWRREPLPKGPARVARLEVVHDEENEARHYAQKGYGSPLGDAGEWSHPSKRVWVLRVGEAASEVVRERPEVSVQVFGVELAKREGVGQKLEDGALPAAGLGA